MSRIGKMPIIIPDGVSVDIKGKEVIFKGPKGEEKVQVHDSIKVNYEENKILCTRDSEDPEIKAFHGLVRSLLNNCLIGVTDGFEIILDLLLSFCCFCTVVWMGGAGGVSLKWQRIRY